MEEWEKALILHKDERLEYGAKASRGSREKGFEQGAVALTNLRLVWLRSGSILSNTYKFSFEVPIQDIRSLSTGGIAFKHVIVTCKDREEKFHPRGSFRGKKASTQDFCECVNRLIVQRETQIMRDRKRDRVVTHINVNFGDVQDLMRDGGVMLRSYKCPDCGAPTGIPENGYSMRCEHCGTRIQVNDVIRRVRKLIEAASE